MTQLSSFVRQLNFYGFRKVKNVNKQMIYKHKHFRKDAVEELPLIKRKKMIKKTKEGLKQKKKRAIYGELRKLEADYKNLENRILEVEKEKTETEEANQHLKQKQEEFDVEAKRRIDKMITSFNLFVCNFDRPMVSRVCKFFINSGFCSYHDVKKAKEAENKNEKSTDFNEEEAFAFVEQRVRRLIFYRNEEENKLDEFYNCVSEKNFFMENDQNFQIDNKKFSEAFYRVLFEENEDRTTDNSCDISGKGSELLKIGKEKEEAQVFYDDSFHARSIKLFGENFSDNESLISLNDYIEQFKY